MKQKIISAHGLTKIYKHPSGNITVLKDTEFHAFKKESVAITGESGRGKTTLLYLLAGLDSIDSGSIEINGTRIDTLSERKMAVFRSEEIGFIFQHHFLLSDLDALSNALLPLRITKQLTLTAVERIKNLFEKLGIAQRMTHKPHELSGGERQRVAVIRALANNPSIIFADEPTGSLDKENALHLEEILFELVREHSTTLIISTHSSRLAERSERIIRIEDISGVR